MFGRIFSAFCSMPPNLTIWCNSSTVV